MNDLKVEVGEIIYPYFDTEWEHNQTLGLPAWKAIRLFYDKNRRGGDNATHSGRYFCRVDRMHDGGTDTRMAGKLIATIVQRGLVVFVDNPQAHIVPAGDLEQQDVDSMLRRHLGKLYILPTTPKILGLKVTKVNSSSLVARVEEITLLRN